MITSRTSRIPQPGQGNLDWTLLTGTDITGMNYNKLDYQNAENFVFRIDK
jgi:hypothetical protein